MNNIKAYVISVCCAMILSGVFYVIRPSGKIQSTIKIIIVLFLFSVSISPLINFDSSSIDKDFNVLKEYDINNDLSNYIKNEIDKESKEQLVIKIGDILSARGITDYKLKFENNDNFEIICVNIYTNQKSTGLKEYLESKLSINVNIVED